MSAYNGTVASITVRATLGRKRAVLFAVPPLILIGTAAALRLSHPALASWPARILGQFGFSVVLPLTALIIGTSVIGAEIDDGSIVSLLATPVRRSTVIVTKFAVASVVTIVFAAVPELVAGLIATGGTTQLAAGLFAGAVVVLAPRRRGPRGPRGGPPRGAGLPRNCRRAATRAGGRPPGGADSCRVSFG
jgi:ABC-2 type transport system permease protein